MPLAKDTLLQGGKYKIVRHISNGGFGVTYEAEHVLLHKRLAVKEFFVKDFCNRDEVTNHVTVGTKTKVQLVSRLKKKFIDEAIAISSLSHPNIVNVSDVFEEHGTAYYVMDYIDGKSLHQLVNAKGALPEKTAVGYILQIADALEYVHSNNRLHLDIKPGNIMIAGDGRAVLIDFGASKQYDEVNGENTSTLTGRTPGYAPVEQMGNRIQTFNPATDIYSLGATLYKAVSGITPPDSTAIADDETLLLPLPKKISDATRRAVTAAMETKRKNRPQSIGEFTNILTDGQAKEAREENKPKESQQKKKPEPEDEDTLFETQNARKPQADSNISIDYDGLPPEEEGERPYKMYAMIGAVAIAIIAIIILIGTTGVTVSDNSQNDTVVAAHHTENVNYMKYTNSAGVVTGYYTGTLVDGKMDGEGEFKYVDGGLAKGTFKDDRIVDGRMTSNDGYYFEGTFVDGNPYNGTWYEPNGTVNSKVKDGIEQ